MEKTTSNTPPVLDDRTRRFIASPAGFYERYIELLAFYGTNEQTYAAVERQHAAIVGKNRFKSYESFRSAYSQWCRRRIPTPSKHT